MSDNAFGPDRTDEPGVTPRPDMVVPPQLTDFMVESCVIHSKSKGWLPAVTFRLLADDGVGMVCTIAVGPEVVKISEDIMVCAARAIEDWRAAGGELS